MLLKVWEAGRAQVMRLRGGLAYRLQVFGPLVFSEGFLGQVSNKGLHLYAFEALGSHRTYP